MMTFYQWLEERDPLVGQQFGVSNTKRGGDNTGIGHLIASSYPKSVKPSKAFKVFDGLKVNQVYGKKRMPSGIMGEK